MSVFKRALSLALATVFVLGLAACGGGEQGDDTVYREPYKADDVVEETRFVDTDGDFDYKTEKWDGPEGYVIVISAGDSNAKLAAEYLQDYYKRMHKVTLQIVTDGTAAKDKEIIIGNTKRGLADTSRKENELKCELKSGKLVFSGGHYVTLEAAVKRFTRLFPDKNEAFTFSLATDFVSTPTMKELDNKDAYKYIWGDEFEDWYDLDFGRWNFRAGMSGSPSAIIAYDRDVIDVGDGRLKIHAINFFDPNKPEVLFKMPWSTATNETFNFLYCYAEIRARIPFYKGTWPSWWGGTATAVYPRDKRWHAEVDVFEIFGNEKTVVPNIHKWYDDYPYEEIYNTGDIRHTTYGNKKDREAKYQLKHYVYENFENLSNEYHIYGYEWTPTEMSFYVDGTKYCTMDIVNTWDLEKDMSMFQDPQYTQFNSHVFVNDASYKPNLIYDNMKLLPSEYYIDYIRFYQKNDGKSKIWLDTSKRGTEPYGVREKAVEEFGKDA